MDRKQLIKLEKLPINDTCDQTDEKVESFISGVDTVTLHVINNPAGTGLNTNIYSGVRMSYNAAIANYAQKCVVYRNAVRDYDMAKHVSKQFFDNMINATDDTVADAMNKWSTKVADQAIVFDAEMKLEKAKRALELAGFLLNESKKQ